MRNIFILVLFSTFMVGCSQNKPTIEEEILMKAFASYQAALVYNEKCNNATPKDRYDINKNKNINLLGNEQMLAARVGGLQHVRFPKASVDDLVKNLVAKANKIKLKAADILDEKGCDSEEAITLQKSYALFSQLHPPQVYGFLDKEIESKGGVITSYDEIEAVNGPPSERGK